MHSLTKYIGGHGTSIGGAIVDNGSFDWAAQPDRYPGLDQARPVVPRRRLDRRARAVGLHRPRSHGAAAQHGRGDLAVQRVPVPAGHRDAAAAHGAPQPERARRSPSTSRSTRRCAGSTTPGWRTTPTTRSPSRTLRGGYGALVTFGIDGGLEAGRTFIESLGLFSHLANIGDAKSLAIHPATTTHSQLNDEELAAAGVTPDTVRLAVGHRAHRRHPRRHRPGAREGPQWQCRPRERCR